MAGIFVSAENLISEENFDLKANRIPYETESDKEIEDIQPQTEEDTEEPHLQYYQKKLIRRRLVHSIDSPLDPSTFDEISYLNK